MVGADLWEQESGQQWLRRLVFAAIYELGIKGGVGAERLSAFFHRVCIDGHVASSATALRGLRDQMEAIILAYGDEQARHYQQPAAGVEICAGADETFFDQVILVMMDLVSGYIVVEEFAEDRTYATWHERVQQALTPLGITLRYVVSDRAKALVKLALEGFSCPSIPDVFHALRDLTKVMSIGLHLKLARVEQKRVQAEQKLHTLQANGKETPIEQRLIDHLSAQAAALRADQASAQALLRQASQVLHPFTLADSRRQSVARVETVLEQTLTALSQIRARHSTRDNMQAVTKFRRQIPALASLVDLWWQGVEQSLFAQGLDVDTQYWLVARLLPAYYWQQQVAKTKTPALKAAYQQAFERAADALRQHPLSEMMADEEVQRWQGWASEWAAKFQRASSAVEGRNGYLSQLNHCARGTPAKRLKVMTVIHNFDLKRADGTTAAERLFGRPAPDLFDWMMARMGPLPLPRKARSPAKPKPLILKSVPA